MCLFCVVSVLIDDFFNNIQTDNIFLKNYRGGIEPWQDVQHQFTVIARKVEGQTAQCVELAIEDIAIIPHILHRILHYQTVLLVVVVVADKLR